MRTLVLLFVTLAFVGPPGSVFYESPTAVYVWADAWSLPPRPRLRPPRLRTRRRGLQNGRFDETRRNTYAPRPTQNASR